MQRVIGTGNWFSPKALRRALLAWALTLGLRRAGPSWLLVGLGLVAGLGLGLAARQLALGELERQGIEIKALGRETPLDFGAPYETLTLPVNGRLVQARTVQADTATSRAVLIFHGNGESISDWSHVQASLRAVGIASMVFDYSGFGDSTGTPSVAHLREDAQAAYRAFVEQWPQAGARYVLGHSLGNAVLLDVLPALRPGPAGVVVHAGFTSAREMATQTGLAAPWLAALLPDLWDNEAAIANPGPATLVMHSEADEVIPPQMGLRLAEAAGPRARFVGLRGIRHDSLYQEAEAEEWQPIVNFIHGGGLAESAAVWPEDKLPRP
jgi:alpha-beta hydrolase superfamily lysophospholipase